MSFDLFISSIVSVTVFFLGVVVYIHDSKSALNRTFVLICLATIFNVLCVYLSLHQTVPDAMLWWIRFTVFFAILHTIFFFLFIDTFPGTTFHISRRNFLFLSLAGVIGLAAVLSPYAFTGVANGAPTVGFLIPLVGILIVGLLAASFYLAIVKYRKTAAEERLRWLWVIIGMFATYSLLVFLVLIGNIVFSLSYFVPYTAAFMLPMMVGMTYAIIRHHLLNIKVIATEIMTYMVVVISLFQVFFSATPVMTLISLAVAVAFLIFGVLLVQSVQREVQQREQLELLNKKIEADNKQLEDLGRFKSQLLSLASHQIRSPLAAMKGFITLIIQGSYGDVSDKIKETLKKVQQSADELIALINTLLDMRKVEEGKMEYSFEKVDLVSLVAGTVESIMPLAQAKNLTLTSALPPTPVMVNIDREKFKQVIQNLIDNAIKYTPSGFVKVELTTNQGKATIAVSDSGYGIPAALIPFLFEEFIRDERIKKEVRGTGLGLYIARKIAEAHGGTLVAESPGESKGSTFKATIPMAQ